MRAHSPTRISLLKKFRKEGLSINELVKKLDIPRTTVWYYVHSLKLSIRSQRIIRAKYGGSAKREERNRELARVKAKEMLSSPHRDAIIAFAMLYWSEGNKRECNFVNTDGLMISTYLLILRKVLTIPEVAIQPVMRVFTGMDSEKCLVYWSKVTKIPKRRFRIYFNDGGSAGKSPFGMCRIIVKRPGQGGNVLKLVHSIIEIFTQDIIDRYTSS